MINTQACVYAYRPIKSLSAYLKQQTLLSGLWITLLGHLVARTSNFNKLLYVNSDLFRCRLSWSLLGFFSSTSCTGLTKQHLLHKYVIFNNKPHYYGF